MKMLVGEEYRAAKARIERHLQEAIEAIAKACDVADETGVGFNWEGFDYGMGGWYTPRERDENGEWSESSEGGWQGSSNSC